MLRIAVVHKSSVNCVNLTVDGAQYSRHIAGRELGKNVSNLILQAKWCRIGDSAVLILASQHGIQIYDVEGTILLHWYALSCVGDADEQTETFARGITSLGSDLVCVGTHEGTILAFLVTDDNSNIKLEHTLRGHAIPIGDLSSNGDILASGDDAGLICVWRKDGSDIFTVHRLQGYRSPCTSLATWSNFLLAGFTSGHLQLFCIQKGILMAEVAAHGRAVTSVDIAPQTGLALSASEDTFVRFWQLNATEEPCIEHKHSEMIQDSQICGACFLTSSGSGFCVSSFDSEELICFSV